MKVQLKVWANEKRGVLVTHLEALETKSRRFVGWKYDDKIGEAGGFRAKAEPDVLHPSCRDHLNEYLRAIKTGELIPADEATAKLAGVQFVTAKTVTSTKSNKETQ